MPGFARLDPASHLVRDQGPFRLRRIHPGAHLATGDDRGFGGLGLVDHAALSPGLRVRMHEHRDDEIVSYLRAGSLVHTDTSGATETVRPDRLMVMNSGAGFSHEEAVPGPGETRMLQIFVRPHAPALAPAVQFVDLGAAVSAGAWRLLVGPSGSEAPATVRQRLRLYDARLPAGSALTTPTRPGWASWLYVFDGAVTVDGEPAATHEALSFDGSATVVATRETDLVLFLVDRAAPASRAGTLSGRA